MIIIIARIEISSASQERLNWKKRKEQTAETKKYGSFDAISISKLGIKEQVILDDPRSKWYKNIEKYNTGPQISFTFLVK